MSTEVEKEEVDYLPVDETQQEDLDAVDLMWIERMNRPFTPSIDKPMRSTRCTAVTRNGARAGRRCAQEAFLGTHVCTKHGAQLPVVKDAAIRRRSEIVLMLVGLGGDAVSTLQDLMENATSEAVRLGASRDVLDRAGVRGGSEIDVTVSAGGRTPADVLHERLEKMRERSTINADPVEDEDADPLELDASTTTDSAEGEPDHG